MNAEILKKRAELLARIRSFFRTRDVLEVTTPCVVEHPVSELNIESVRLATQSPSYLRTSPESGHKWLLAHGVGDLYELGPVFRAGELGRHHQPEFTLLEWYRVGMDWHTLALEVTELINDIADGRHTPWPIEWISWTESVHQQFRLNLDQADHACLLDLLPKTQRPDAISGHWSKAELIDYLFATGVQAHFSPEVITVVHDYPANQAALAELCADGQHAKRFEIFIGPVELANGYQELTDPKEQHARFVADQHARKQHGLAVGPMDRRLLAALEQGMPACSGVALGVDRLIMVVLGVDAICETLTFGTHDSLASKNDPS